MPLPLSISFRVWDFTLGRSWQLRNSRLNFQSRDGLDTLRNVAAWQSDRGMERHGALRAIMPSTPTITLPLTLNLHVELRWGSAFLNITTQVRNDWILRPTRAGSWEESTSGPPRIEFLQPPGGPAAQSPATARPRVGIINVTPAAGPSSGPSTDAPPPENVVEIIEEVDSTTAFQRNQPGGIPFAAHPNHLDAVAVAPQVQNAITLNEVNQNGLLSFDEGMALVRGGKSS